MEKTVARMEYLLKSAETLSELIDVYCSAFVSRIMLSLSVGITHSFSQVQEVHHRSDRQQSRNEVLAAPSWSS